MLKKSKTRIKKDKTKGNKVNYKIESLEEGQNMLVNIPKIFFETCNEKKDVFDNKISENRKYEQYFWTSKTVNDLLDACEYITNTCCFTTPSLAHAFHEKGREEKLLDIDERFNYLPRFEKFDIINPHYLDEDNFNIIVIDPPFFNISTKELFEATNVITNNNFSTKIIITYLVRFEYPLLETLKPYGISETNLHPQYAHIKSNKWRNFKIYSNIDLPNLKRISGKYGFKKKY